MKNINIKIKKNRTCSPSEVCIGRQGENMQYTLVFGFVNEFVDGIGYVEVKKPDGTTGYIQATKVGETYELPVKSSLLNQTGIVEFELRITENEIEDETPVFKSEMFKLQVHNAINATSTIPEEYPSWIDIANSKLIEIDNLDLDANKVGTVTTVVISKKDGTTKEVEISDGLQGQDGEPGRQGEKGDTVVSVQVGTTTTGEPGTEASVTNVGTETEAILNFTIPRGNNGSADNAVNDVKVNNESVVDEHKVANIDLSGYVNDANYVHTDNNFDNSSKQQVDNTINMLTGDGVTLENDSINYLVMNNSFNFTLPTVTDEKFHQILVSLLYFNGDISWGTDNFFNCEQPTVETGGRYDIVFEYDGYAWFCGIIKKGSVS